MERLFLDYNQIMYATIYKVLHERWSTEDVLQESVRKLIDHIPQLRKMDDKSLINYIVVACRHNAIAEKKLRMMLTRARSKARKAMEAEFGGK